MNVGGENGHLSRHLALRSSSIVWASICMKMVLAGWRANMFAFPSVGGWVKRPSFLATFSLITKKVCSVMEGEVAIKQSKLLESRQQRVVGVSSVTQLLTRPSHFSAACDGHTTQGEMRESIFSFHSYPTLDANFLSGIRYGVLQVPRNRSHMKVGWKSIILSVFPF